ncbi:MAG: hypothetical protein QNK11_03025, partial [Legionella sp.]|nr:hypothetical protein [Legionella sp.]
IPMALGSAPFDPNLQLGITVDSMLEQVTKMIEVLDKSRHGVVSTKVLPGPLENKLIDIKAKMNQFQASYLDASYTTTPITPNVTSIPSLHLQFFVLVNACKSAADDTKEHKKEIEILRKASPRGKDQIITDRTKNTIFSNFSEAAQSLEELNKESTPEADAALSTIAILTGIHQGTSIHRGSVLLQKTILKNLTKDENGLIDNIGDLLFKLQHQTEELLKQEKTTLGSNTLGSKGQALLPALTQTCKQIKAKIDAADEKNGDLMPQSIRDFVQQKVDPLLNPVQDKTHAYRDRMSIGRGADDSQAEAQDHKL